MRIALVTDAWSPQINGVVRTWQTVVGLIERAGHEVLVVHPGLFRTLPLPMYPEIRLSIMPGRKLRHLLDDFRPDAVHIPTEGTLGLAARRYCRKRSLAFTTSFHTHYAKYGHQYVGVPPRLAYRALRWFHGPAERTLVPTPSVKRELEAQGFRNLIVWTRGVDAELFQPYGKALLDHLPRPVFLYCGRVAREKNIEAFLDADLPGSKLVVGDGPEMPSLRARYRDVAWVGYKTGLELARHVAAADVFVFPSVTDTFGVVMLEAMACGVPVAAYPVTGPLDVVRNGETGVLHDDLSTAARRALNLSPAACRRQALEYTWDRCAGMVLEHLAV